MVLVKYLNYLMVMVMVISGLPGPARAALTLATGVRFNAFQDDQAQEATGAEVTFPLSVSYARQPFAVRLVTAYSRVRLTSPDGAETTIAAVTDTLVAATYTLSLSKLALQGGVTLNLPTGKTRLNKQEAQALAGKDNNLLEVSHFGEGFNLGFNLSAAQEFGRVTAALNGAWLRKGAYHPYSLDQAAEFDPGDQWLAAVLAQWRASPALTLGAGVTYAYLTADQVNGQESYHAGGSVALKGNFQARPAKALGLALNVLYQIPQKSQEAVNETLRTEADNSRGALLAAMFDVTYAYSPTLTLHLFSDVRRYGESPRQDSMTGLPYAGQRLRYTFGPGVTYALNKQLAYQVIATYGVLREDADITRRAQITTTGVNVNFGVKYQF